MERVFVTITFVKKNVSNKERFHLMDSKKASRWCWRKETMQEQKKVMI